MLHLCMSGAGFCRCLFRPHLGQQLAGADGGFAVPVRLLLFIGDGVRKVKRLINILVVYNCI